MHRADRDSVRLAAASFIVERGWGKAPQAIEHSGKDGDPIEHNRDLVVTFVNPDGSRERLSHQEGISMQHVDHVGSHVVAVLSKPLSFHESFMSSELTNRRSS